MIEALIIYLLEVHATTGVSSNLLDSGGAGVRVYHNRIRQSHGKNAVVFNIITETPNYRHQPGSGSIAVQDEVGVQFDIWHENDHEARTISKNLRTIIEGWSGEHEGSTYNYIILTATRDAYDDNQRIAGKSQDYNIRRNI
jgi:hypothetical protein